MCPICATTTLAVITAGVTSTGGITALVVRKLRGANNSNQERQEQGERHEQEG
jgi:hypothetical protein